MFANSLGLNRELQDGIARRLKRHEQDGESDRAKEPIGGRSKQRRPLLLVAHFGGAIWEAGCVGLCGLPQNREQFSSTVLLV